MKFVADTCSLRRRRPDIFLALVSVLVVGCHSENSPSHKPSLQVTRAPLANPGGPEQLDYIEGRAIGAGPGQQVVVYAHSGVWWIQPFTNRPFTKIQADSTWKNSTHLGTEYAALLVEPGYHPESKIATLPKEGNGVVAVVMVSGKAAAPIISKVIHFSGYDWIVRSAGSDRGGEPNSYNPANAWVDQKGYLHLRMAVLDGRWSCADVRLTRSLGYGTYRFVVHDSAHLEPSAVLGMFTWDEGQSDETRSELDIELSRWGNPNSKNAQYVVQPYYVPENISRFMAPPGVLTHIFRWEPGVVSFKTIRGSVERPASKSISEHVFTSGIPTPAAETVHIELYDFHHSRNGSQLPTEVVIEKFEYLP
ncbi:MAG: hypothetical protein WDN23_02115 [Edaphobacter sp.]